MTAQMHERLFYDGIETSMAFCPPLPRRHPRIVPNDDEAGRSEFLSTACWRGYRGTWEVRDDRFWLVHLAGKFELVGSDPLLATWFRGTLRIPRGEMLHDVHMGFGSVYEQEIHVRVAEGIVTGSDVYDNRGREHDPRAIGWQNLPGFENRFEGDGRGTTIRHWIGSMLRRIVDRDPRPPSASR